VQELEKDINPRVKHVEPNKKVIKGIQDFVNKNGN
jgi:hypothetical protein